MDSTIPVAVDPREARGRTAVGFLYALVATILWSIVPIGIKYLLRQALDPFTIAFSRFVLASSALWLIAKARGKVRPVNRADLPLYLMGGIGMAGNYILYALGLQYTTASATNIIVQDEVVALVILSHFILGERIGRVRVLGMLFAVCGIAVVLWNGQSLAALVNSQYLLGNVIILFAGLSWPLYGLAQKLLSRRMVSSTLGLTYIFGVAAILSAVPAALGANVHGRLEVPVFAWLFLVGVVSTGAAYLCLARAFSMLAASTVAVTTCMLPIFTLVTAAIFLGEPLTPVIALGAAFVVAGIGIIGRDEAAFQQNRNSEQ
ncbi:MAG: DMT family transporter [Armatimonadota bacterium]|nr:DMT family transporter [Armatimonadota bacterium]